ncbi:hypothetical protein RvY_18249 [Ramazzottius varieornatus]|uniref:BTB domain-containing protein n=1 Tax=Ramazzottius varieornatus TaxID=947166 RepID=A0A1D1W6S2_RAMVA|nr:hypothetical protein RvY_18249 [Ramazzottius varieornatus]
MPCPIIRISQVWGPNPALVLLLEGDTLRCPVRVRLWPPKQVGADPLALLETTLETILDSEMGKYFVLVSAEGKKRDVHRAFLAANCEVFEAMLQSDTVEAKSRRCQMEDVSSATMDIRLDHMCSTQSLQGAVRDVLVAAGKHQMQGLKTACLRTLLACC